MSTFDEMLEDMYDLDRTDMRRLAWELLLASDGPNKISGDVEGSVDVSTYEGERNEFLGFIIYDTTPSPDRVLKQETGGKVMGLTKENGE